MRLVNLEQGSADWLRWRRGGIGASDAPHLTGAAAWSDPEKLRRQKLAPAEDRDTPAQAHGRRLEPEARQLFCDLTGLVMSPACVEHDTLPWLRASLDGLTEDRANILEVKCPWNPLNHRKIVDSGRCPNQYYPQLQHQLIVTGLPAAYFCCYCPDKMFAVRDQAVVALVEADPDWQRDYLRRAGEFWASLGA